MVYYAPAELPLHKVTITELICASTCFTSMLCFTLEKKYRAHRTSDMSAGDMEYRLAARGNATSFPLPWVAIMEQLRNAEQRDGLENDVALPRSPEEVCNFVFVLLKTNDEDSKDSMAKFVHQAIVRRTVVVELIENMHRRPLVCLQSHF